MHIFTFSHSNTQIFRFSNFFIIFFSFFFRKKNGRNNLNGKLVREPASGKTKEKRGIPEVSRQGVRARKSFYLNLGVVRLVFRSFFLFPPPLGDQGEGMEGPSAVLYSS